MPTMYEYLANSAANLTNSGKKVVQAFGVLLW